MATKRWRGDAPAVAQVVTIAVTAFDVTTTYKVTMNGKVVSVLGITDANTTAAALQAALAASTIPEFAEVTWTVSTSTVTGTAKTAGRPFTATSSVSGGTGTIGAVTTATASSGPNDWSVAANWDASGVPAAADDVVIEASATDILYGIDQNAITLTSLTIRANFTGKIGLPAVNGSGASAYYEYRPQYLKIGATTINVGDGAGAGSGRIKLDTIAVQTALTVNGTGSSADTGLEALLWKGTHASNTLTVNKGSVGVARFAGETAVIATLRVGYITNVGGDATVYCASGVTLTTVNESGGKLTTNSACTTFTQTGGIATLNVGNVTTLSVLGGTCYYRGVGTIGTLNVEGTIDFSQDQRGRTVSDCEVYGKGAIKDPFKTVTWSAGIDLNFTGLNAQYLDLGQNLKITPAAVT
jgi:trimeric autotransporter adhesin